MLHFHGSLKKSQKEQKNMVTRHDPLKFVGRSTVAAYPKISETLVEKILIWYFI